MKLRFFSKAAARRWRVPEGRFSRIRCRIRLYSVTAAAATDWGSESAIGDTDTCGGDRRLGPRERRRCDREAAQAGRQEMRDDLRLAASIAAKADLESRAGTMAGDFGDEAQHGAVPHVSE